MLFKGIIGKEVLDVRGKVVGRIVNMDVDIVRGAIKQIVIRTGVLGVKHINPDDIVVIGDKVILRRERSSIKGIEIFKLPGIKRRMLFSC